MTLYSVALELEQWLLVSSSLSLPGTLAVAGAPRTIPYFIRLFPHYAIFHPIIPALCQLRERAYYARNYAGIIASSLIAGPEPPEHFVSNHGHEQCQHIYPWHACMLATGLQPTTISLPPPTPPPTIFCPETHMLVIQTRTHLHVHTHTRTHTPACTHAHTHTHTQRASNFTNFQEMTEEFQKTLRHDDFTYNTDLCTNVAWMETLVTSLSHLENSKYR